MLVEIHNMGGGANDTLHVYEVTNRKSKTTAPRPFCSIYEDDFLDLLSEAESDKAANGKIHFNVNKMELFTRCKRGFSIMFFALFLSFTAYATGDKCTAVTKKGTPCANYAQKGAKVCYVHNPANQCEGKTKAGEKCKAMKQKGSKFCSRHGEQK